MIGLSGKKCISELFVLGTDQNIKMLTRDICVLCTVRYIWCNGFNPQFSVAVLMAKAKDVTVMGR